MRGPNNTNMEVDIEQVFTAVNSLYGTTGTGSRDPSDVNKASLWLGELQKSVSFKSSIFLKRKV